MRTDDPRPDAVAHVVRFLEKRRIWFQLTRNQPARSCRDAARKRNRLGHVGIPLRDEMKSFFGSYRGRDGQERLVIAHCRADRLLDLAALADILHASAPPTRLGVEELRGIGSEYGLVNPFETWDPNAMDGRFLQPHAGVRQVFDVDLLEPLGTPGTVMTNAGDLTWGVELLAGQLRERLDNRRTTQGVISEPDPAAPRRPPFLGSRRTIAIITGNGPECGVSLWSSLNEHVRHLLGDAHAGDTSKPPVRIESLPELGMAMELDRRADHVWVALEPAIKRMCAEDVALLALACNITPFFADRIRSICEPRGVELVSLPDVVASWLIHAGEVREAALIGVPPVVNFKGGVSPYEVPFEPFSVEELSDRALDRIKDLAYHVKREGPDEAGLNLLRRILKDDISSAHVVLALNELSVLIPSQKKPGRSGKVLIDPLAVYSEAIARRWLGLPFPSCTTQWAVTMCALTSAPAGLSNEDCVLLGPVAVQQTLSEDGVPPSGPFVKARRTVLLGDEGAPAVWVAVADGLGGHAAGAEASRMVIDRLRSASDASDEDSVAELLVDVHDDLTADSDEDRDRGRHPRGATAAGMVLSAAAGCDQPAAAVAFSAGDCVLLRVGMHDGQVRVEWADETLVPQVDAEGHPSGCLGGGRAPKFDVETLAPLVGSTCFVICSDGFPKRLGLPLDRDLPAALSQHSAVAEIWKELASEPMTDHQLRQLLRRLYEAVESFGTGQPDDMTIVIVQLELQPAGSGTLNR